MAGFEIGFLVATDNKIWKKYIKAFEGALGQDWNIVKTAPVNAKDVRIEYAESKGGVVSPFSTIAGNFVTAGKNVIVTSGTLPAIACREATKTGTPPIPVVYAAVGNPQGSQLRPGNMTGGWNQQASEEMVQARMNHLIAEWNKNHKTSPIATLGVVYNNQSGPSFTEAGAAVAAAGDARIPNVLDLRVNTQAEIQALQTAGVDAYYVCSDPLVTEFIDDIPSTIFAVHAFAEHCDDHSGPCSFGPNLRDMFGTAGTYVSLILSAATPAARSALAGKLPVFTGAIEHRPSKNTVSAANASRPHDRGLESAGLREHGAGADEPSDC